MLNLAPAASLAAEEEYPQADGRCREANDQKDASNGTLVVKKPRTYKHIDIMGVPQSKKNVLGGLCTVVLYWRGVLNDLREGDHATVAQSRGKSCGDLNRCK